MKNVRRKAVPRGPAAPGGTLGAALATIPDARRPYGWRRGREPLPLAALLQVAVAALLCGARSLYAIAQWGRERREDDPGLLEALGLPPGRSPSVATLHRVFKALDVDAFERAVGGWLAATGVAADEALALVGKALRGIHGEEIAGAHLVGAYAHRSAVLIGQLRTAGKGHELAGAKTLLAELPLERRVVTGDALLTQRDVSEQVVAGGGDYLFPVDANQPALLADLVEAFSPVGADGA